MYEIEVTKEIGNALPVVTRHGARDIDGVERRKAAIRASVPAGSVVTIKVTKRY